MQPICAKIEAVRDAGYVVCCVLDADENLSRAEFLAAQGLSDIADAVWREIDRVAAETIITTCLGRSLASSVDLVPKRTAAGLAARFLSLFDPGITYLTNGNLFGLPGIGDTASWDPISSLTYDTGVLAVANGAPRGIFWVSEDD